MSHCLYLPHKFVINYLFDYYSVCLYSSYWLLGVSRSFTGGWSPHALRVTKPIWLWLLKWLKYTVYSTVLLLLVSPCILHRNNHTVHLTNVFIVWKEDTSLPAMFNPLCSSMNQQLFKWTFVIKVATMKITDDLMEAITCLPLNWHFSWWTKVNGTQRRAVVSPWRMHCMCSGMAKSTSQAQAKSNSKKIKPVALAIVELRESESIRQAGS